MCKPAHAISKGFDRGLEFNGRALSVALRHSNCFLKRLHVFLIFFLYHQKVPKNIILRYFQRCMLNSVEYMRRSYFAEKIIFAKKLYNYFRKKAPS